MTTLASEKLKNQIAKHSEKSAKEKAKLVEQYKKAREKEKLAAAKKVKK